MTSVLRGAALFCAAIVFSSAQTFSTLVNFNGANGSEPDFVSLVQGVNGNLYGTVATGGANGLGTIFQMTPAGALTTVYSFGGADGAHPFAGLILAADGNFYGTTAYGGANNSGTVYKMTPSGTLTTLYSFCAMNNCADGAMPYGALAEDAEAPGSFYGTTIYGGTSVACPLLGCGTIFTITSGGDLTTLHSFQGAPADGLAPYAALLLGTSGNFYGTTSLGGANNAGTVFTMTPAGVVSILHDFNAGDGYNVTAGLILAGDGSFYGTAAGGGQYGEGTVFRIIPSGAFKVLYSFCMQDACGDGAVPFGPVALASDGNFYGATYQGGSAIDGSLYRLTSSGAFSTIHNFQITDGLRPMSLAQATNGTLYGVTQYGGTSNEGTVFSLSRGLSPFIETIPLFGKVGSTVLVLGTNLTGASSVTFNGLAAKYTVVSASEITATVPPGATTGTVQVTTPAGTISSILPYRVR